jgi:hypothetical protein
MTSVTAHLKALGIVGTGAGLIALWLLGGIFWTNWLLGLPVYLIVAFLALGGYLALVETIEKAEKKKKPQEDDI